MILKRTKVFGRSESSIGVVAMYIAAAVIALIAIGLLVDNIIMFKSTVAQYVAQGYPSAQVVQQLIPSQLLPGLFEGIAVYGGIALILFGIGMINQKISRSLRLLGVTEVGAIEIQNNEHAEDSEQVNRVIDETQQS